jgi:enoyl-CoA hydratase/carnithine racemase
MSDKDILTKIEDHVLTITINRPEKRNSITSDMLFTMANILREANLNDDIRCIVFTGTGDFYSSGTDLGAGLTSRPHEHGEIDLETINETSGHSQIALAIYGCYKPVIGAINGPAVGIGASMLALMDFRLMSETARLGFVFTRRGVVPEACCSWMLPKVVGLTKATDWMITGRLVEAKEALDSGFTSGGTLYKPADLLPATYAIARDIVQNTSSLAVAYTRQLIWQHVGASDPDKIAAIESAGIAHLTSGPEALEGVKSFFEKRPPQFPGKVSKDMPSFFPWWEKS